MNGPRLSTHFAPAERSNPKEIEAQARDVARNIITSSQVKMFLDAVPDGVMILNGNRQIVFANDALLKSLHVENAETVFGLRPGEALRCVHSSESEGGCGTTEHCSTCGAVLAILAAQKAEKTHAECRIMLEGGHALDFAVSAAPLMIEGERYVVFALMDIAHEKRRRVLERTFFHDLLNTSTVLSGYTEMARDRGLQKENEIVSIISATVHRLIDEIQSQRDLLAAESDELELNWKGVHSLELVNQAADTYRMYHSRDITIVVDSQSNDQLFQSDPVLLGRVLGNMMKNALEASAKGDVVSIGCRTSGGQVEFYVHNRAVMPKEVQLQIFMRSFSTKSSERGIGTYSMKLFTERFLKGKITFTSEEGKGTTFVASFPIE